MCSSKSVSLPNRGLLIQSFDPQFFFIGLLRSSLHDLTVSAWTLTHFKQFTKYSNVFRENRCPPPRKPVYGGNFSHEAVTLKIRSRSPNSNKLLMLSDLYRLANLVTFHYMVHETTCRLTPFGLILVDYVWQWPWKLHQGHQNLFSFLSCRNVINANLVKIHQLVHEVLCSNHTFWLKFGSLSPAKTLKNRSKSPKSSCPNVKSMQIWLKSANQLMRYGAHKHFLA